ncbi:MAG: hypothetical protein NT007_18285 [Candidatus Kapabacteria bacterium]|nr:hypothetical protein [Candidatus Kapabacteria bacterium]
MQVLKIGGSFIKDIHDIELTAKILKLYSNSNNLIIISAFDRTTRNLIDAASIAKTGDSVSALAKIHDIIGFHYDLINLSIKNKQIQTDLFLKLEPNFLKLKEYILGISITGELTNKTLDSVMAFGEFFAFNIIFHYFKEQKIDITCFDSSSVIITDNNFGSARPIIDITKENILKIFDTQISKHRYSLTQGFVARTLDGSISTMGIESSNLTATIYAATLGAKELSIWTNVEGIKTADPEIFPDAQTIKNINYYTAARAAENGLKLLYPEMIKVAINNCIKINIRSVYSIESAFTEISDNSASDETIIIIHENLNYQELRNEKSESTYNLFSIACPDRIINLSKKNISDQTRQNQTDLIIILNLSEEKFLQHDFLNKIITHSSCKAVSVIKNNGTSDLYIIGVLEGLKIILNSLI